MQQDSVQRFSDRARNYDRFRPGYPHTLVRFLYEAIPVTPGVVVADIAAGTGIFTEQLVQWGNPVYVVEPNLQMRNMAYARLGGYEACVFVDGTAEATGLPGHSVDVFVVAQAFHWFDPDGVRAEFGRVGRDGACVAIVWNLRNTRSAFESGYEAFIRRHAVDYLQVSQRKLDTGDVRSFFRPKKPKYRIFEHADVLSYEQLLGRTLSYSYLPEEGSPRWSEIAPELEALFRAHQRNGYVRLSYKARLFLGRI